MMSVTKNVNVSNVQREPRTYCTHFVRITTYSQRYKNLWQVAYQNGRLERESVITAILSFNSGTE